MGDDTPDYLKMTMKEGEARLGFLIDYLFYHAIPVSHMLEQGNSTWKPDAITKIKEAVYSELVQHIAVEYYPYSYMESNEANLNDLVYSILSPIIYGRRNSKWEADQSIYGGRRKSLLWLSLRPNTPL